MKDRIKQIMESQHMTQQVFADFIGIAPATLSGIFTERTKPTINTIEAIKKKLPTLSTDWLMFGKEPMYIDEAEAPVVSNANMPTSGPGSSSTFRQPSPVTETLIDFSQSQAAVPPSLGRPSVSVSGGRNQRHETESDFMKNFDKMQRRVTEIRIFYDDQTWESFTPSKK